MSTLFKKNCKRWGLFYPDAAKKLGKLNCRTVLLTKNEDGSQNLQRMVKGNAIFYHHRQNPAQEATDWFSRTDLHNISVLFVFGVGLGYVYDAAKSWLSENKNRSLVFLEDDLEVIYHLLHTPRAHSMLYDKQVKICFVDQALSCLRPLTAIFALRHFTTTVSDLYAKYKQDAFEQIKKRLAFFLDPKMAPGHEYTDHGRRFLTNYFQNLLQLPHAAHGSEFFGRFKNVPAIICGAGPSLAKNLELLATLRNNALIFAGGTAMNALNTIGFLPHFGVGIDPNPAQFTRLVMNQAFDTPYFYSSRLYSNALQLIHGEHIYVQGTNDYSISDWFDQCLGLKIGPKLDEGCSVLNFNLSIARALGCNPIIFVGADLAYTKQKAYAPGIHNHPIHYRKAYFVTKSSEEDVIEKIDIFGEAVPSLTKWEAESLFVSQFAQKNKDVTIINATEGGIGFPSVPNCTLEEVKNKFLQTKYDLDTDILKLLKSAKSHPTVTHDAIITSCQIFSDSAICCKTLCGNLQKEYEELTQKIRSTKKIASLSESCNKAFKDLEKEPCYKYLLQSFSDKYAEMHQKTIQDIKFEADLVGEAETLACKAQYTAKKFSFLQETARVCKECIEQTIMNAQEPLERLDKIELAQTSKPGAKFYENGQLKSIITYKNGVLDGEVCLYYPNGTMKRQLYFQDGKRHGKERIWNEKGLLLIEAEFNQDQPTGFARQWHPNGALALEIGYDNDSNVLSFKEWGEKGNTLVTNLKNTSDYYDEMAERTNLLTKVLGQLMEQIKALEPVLSKLRNQSNTTQSSALQLATMHMELETLTKIGQELMKKSGVDSQYEENALAWKGPAAQAAIEQQMRELIGQLSKKLIAIQSELASLVSKFTNNAC